MKILRACCFPSPVQFPVFVSHQSPLFLVFLQYRFEDVLSGFNTLMISSLKSKEYTLKFGQNVIF